jgi:hypothetical protein
MDPGDDFGCGKVGGMSADGREWAKSHQNEKKKKMITRRITRKIDKKITQKSHRYAQKSLKITQKSLKMRRIVPINSFKR